MKVPLEGIFSYRGVEKRYLPKRLIARITKVMRL